MFAAAVVASILSFQAEQPVMFEGRLSHPQILLVQTNSQFDERQLVKNKFKVLQKFEQVGWCAIGTNGKSLIESKHRLLGFPGVLRVEPDRAAIPAYSPNDPLWPEMWHFMRINADRAWDLSFGSPTTVAVIDTGVEFTHPDLAANVWYNAGEIPNNGVDDDLNGYIDDINGYDFAYNDASADDQYGHGTPCAGLVGAVQDNGLGVTGVAPRARIMGLKACYDSGYFYDHMTIPAYLYAADNGARVLSMSFFSDHVSAGERDAINYCWQNGVLPVAAAANENSTIPLYPAAYENVLSVAALNRSDNKASFSNFGTWVDVIAPGVQLLSIARGGGYTNGFGGTSGACPHVAGLATLLFGARPLATNSEVRSAIEDTAISQTQYPFGEYTNYGLVDCRAATQAILGPSAPPRTPVVRYLTPLTFDQRYEVVGQVTRIYGRGFQSPSSVKVFANGEPLQIVSRGRDYVDVENPSVRGTIVVIVNGTPISSVSLPNDSRKIYPAIEASTQGATLVGGFEEMLHADGSELTCTRRDDGIIHFETTFRRVERSSTMLLTVKNRYANGTSGSETVYLYNHSSASYPYGNFEAIATNPVSSTSATTTYSVPNAWRFIDDEGTVICRLTATGTNNTAELKLDLLRYTVP